MYHIRTAMYHIRIAIVRDVTRAPAPYSFLHRWRLLYLKPPFPLQVAWTTTLSENSRSWAVTVSVTSQSRAQHFTAKMADIYSPRDFFSLQAFWEL